MLLLGGPITHAACLAATIHHDTAVGWSVVQWGSHLFRMQAFFFISGFVVSMRSRPRDAWLFNRLTQLGVPLVSTWVLVLTPVVWLSHQTGASTMAYADPQHLWFLEVLIVATVVAEYARPVIEQWSQSLADRRLSLTVVAWMLVAVLIAASTPMASEAMSAHKYRAALIVSSYRYGAFYIVGFVLGLHPRLIERVRHTRLWLVGPIAWMVALLLFWAIARPDPVASSLARRMVIEGSVALASVPMCIFIMHTALRIQRIPRFMNWFSQASYSVYLFHLPLLYLFFEVARRFCQSSAEIFIFGSVFSIAASILIHYLGSTAAWYLLLFNGRISNRVDQERRRFSLRMMRYLQQVQRFIKDGGVSVEQGTRSGARVMNAHWVQAWIGHVRALPGTTPPTGA